MTSNPFDPYGLAEDSTYLGRGNELARISAAIGDTAKGAANHFLVLGPRGTGKSSLMNQARSIAGKHQLVQVYCSIDETTTTKDLFAQIGVALEREQTQLTKSVGSLTEQMQKVFKENIGLLKHFRFGPVGIDIGAPEEDAGISSLVVAADLLCDMLGELIKYTQEIAPKKTGPASTIKPIKGLLLLLDEADMAKPENLPLGSIIKILTEILRLRDVRNIAIGVAGLPVLVDNLLVSHKSSLRTFQRIYLNEVTDEDLSKILIACCATRKAPNEVGISEPASARLVKLAEGYPHWLRHYAAKAFETALSRSRVDNHISVNLDDVEASEVMAVREIGDAYFKHDFNSLDDEHRDLVVALTGARDEEGDVARLSEILKTKSSPERILSLARDLKKLFILGDVAYRGSHTFLDFRTETYRRWAQIHSLELRADDMIPGLDKVLDGLDEKGASGHIEIIGEEIAAFREFSSLIREDTRKWRQLKLRFDRFDHSKFFDSLPAVPSDKPGGHYTSDMLENWRTSNLVAEHLASAEKKIGGHEGNGFAENWERADIIAIPHYLLGYARARGIVSFDDIVEEIARKDEKSADGMRKLRNHLSTYFMAFDETCTYRGEWVAIPHTVLAKVLYHRGKIDEECTSWEAIFKRMDADGKAAPRVLCEDKVGQISIWYEWQMVLAESNSQLFTRHIGEDRPSRSVEFSKLVEDLENNAREKVGQNGIYRAVVNYWKLASNQLAEDRGTTGWWDALQNFEKDRSGAKYLCFSGWSDCARQLTSTESSEGEPPVQIRAAPYFSSSNGRGPAPQSLEGWVFVVPDRSEGQRSTPSLPHRYSRKNVNVSNADLAKLLLSTLKRDWQRQFHKRTGCSPLRSVFGETFAEANTRKQRLRADKESPALMRLGSIVQDSVFESIAKGKSVLEYYRMRAEMLFISCLFYERTADETKLIDTESQLYERLKMMMPEFIKCLQGIDAAEEKCHSWG